MNDTMNINANVTAAAVRIGTRFLKNAVINSRRDTVDGINWLTCVAVASDISILLD
jgi:hypothetical protein